MTPKSAAVTLLVLASLAGCDKAKPRQLPPDPFAAGPPPAAAEATPGEGLSAGLPKSSETAGFFLDHVGQAADPFNKRPAVTAADQPVLFDGFGFDPVTLRPGKGVEVVVDGKAYGTRYGKARPDVARYFKAPELVNVGFRVVLPAGSLGPGPHTAIVRVVDSRGKVYFDSPTLHFEAR